MNEKTKSGTGAHLSRKGLESGLGGGLGNLQNLSNRCDFVGGGEGRGAGRRMIQGSRVGKLGTHCLMVLRVVEPSLLTCLGPPWQPELLPSGARQSAGRVLEAWNTKFWGATPRPYQRVLSRALGRFSHP